MIIARTPLRISFAGGGSDFQEYYQARPGKVVSTTINKYVYVTLNRRFDDRIRVGYSKNELVDSLDAIEHDIIREALRFMGVGRGVEVVYIGDVPLRSTGLGSSSSLTVGVLHALHAFKGEKVGPEQLAREACQLEIEILKRPIGKQDQYAAAFGGLNAIHFHPDERVEVRPLTPAQNHLKTLDQNLLLFYTGIEPGSSAVLVEQKERIPENRRVLDRIVECAQELEQVLVRGEVTGVGGILHQNWLEKQKLARGISNGTIQSYYERALSAGARGGKILGSGGGGFLLLYCESSQQRAVRTALSDLREIPFSFEKGGSQILMV